MHTATLHDRFVVIVFAARLIPTLQATSAVALTRSQGSRLWGLRMVGVGLTLVLRVVMERLATP